MFKVIMMAMVSGITLGITAGSYYAGFDIEGILMALASIFCILAISSFVIIQDKKRITKFE